jgi:hypothetical protein
LVIITEVAGFGEHKRVEALQVREKSVPYRVMNDRIPHPNPSRRLPEHITVRAESLGQEFAMSFARINASPNRYGNLGLMLVGVKPPLDERNVPKEAIYYVDDEISIGDSFTLRLGNSSITRAFRALDTDPVPEVA